MVDLIIINGDLKCVSLTNWKMLQTEGGIPIPECMQEQQDEVDKWKDENNIGGRKQNNQVEFKHIDRIKNLIIRESKGLPEGERVVIVQGGSVWLGKIISNSDIINIYDIK
jgi:hypothetical protein